jgi:hypothetical protein
LSLNNNDKFRIAIEKARARRARRAEKTAENQALSARTDKQGVAGGVEIGGRSKGLLKSAMGKGKRFKVISRAKAEKLLWEVFSRYIRARDKDAGCFSCGGPVQDAGHLISRGKSAAKYDETNVQGQCKKCNWMDRFVRGYHDHCVSAFIIKHGAEKYQELVALSKTLCQRSKADLMEMTVYYSGKLDGLNG